MHVLIVDDHVDTRVLCAAVLRNMGHTFDSVGSLRGALAMATTKAFDLAILDIMLPDGSGYELMRELSIRHGIRGIALTGCHTAIHIARSHAAGFLDHVVKPCELSQLEKALRKADGPFGTDRAGKCTPSVPEQVLSEPAEGLGQPARAI